MDSKMKNCFLFLTILFSLILSIASAANFEITQAEAEKPTVVSTTPNNGEYCVNKYTDWVSVTFSKAMKTMHSVSTCSDWNLSGAQTYWSSDQKTFYLSRTDAGSPLPIGSFIEITLNPIGQAVFQDTEGNYLDTYTFSFTIEIPDICVFKDVPPGFWAEEFIGKIYEAGITSGCSQNPSMYCPEDPVTRAQMAVFLERGIHGSDYSPPGATGIFDDCPVSHWAADWVEQFYADGITSGCSTDPPLYCPDDLVTRAQMAVFLLRSMYGNGYTPPSAVGIFDDVPVTHWASDWIEQLYDEGITGGCSTDPPLYCPDDVVTRAEMAVFIVRAFDL